MAAEFDKVLRQTDSMQTDRQFWETMNFWLLSALAIDGTKEVGTDLALFPKSALPQSRVYRVLDQKPRKISIILNKTSSIHRRNSPKLDEGVLVDGGVQKLPELEYLFAYSSDRKAVEILENLVGAAKIFPDDGFTCLYWASHQTSQSRRW